MFGCSSLYVACFWKLKQWVECGSSLFCLQNMVRILLEATCAVEYDIHGIKW